MVRRLPLKLIRLDFQPGYCLDPEIVTEYMRLMRRRDTIEPVIVCHDGVNYWLRDGFHRFQAAQNLDRKTIGVEVLSGTLADMEAEWKRGIEALKSELKEQK